MNLSCVVLNIGIINARLLSLHVVSVRFSKKSLVGLIVLVFASAFLTLYTVAAYGVSGYVYVGEGTLNWTSSPAGSFLPWPTAPGMLEVLSRMNEVDSFIYTYLIKSWVLAGTVALLWIAVSVWVLKLIRARPRNDSRGL